LGDAAVGGASVPAAPTVGLAGAAAFVHADAATTHSPTANKRLLLIR